MDTWAYSLKWSAQLSYDSKQSITAVRTSPTHLPQNSVSGRSLR